MQLDNCAASITMTDMQHVDEDDGTTYRGVSIEFMDGDECVAECVLYAQRMVHISGKNVILYHGCEPDDLVGTLVTRNDTVVICREIEKLLTKE